MLSKLPHEIDSEDALPVYGCPVLVTSHATDMNEVCLWCFPAVGDVTQDGCPVLVTSHATDMMEVCLWCFPDAI